TGSICPRWGARPGQSREPCGSPFRKSENPRASAPGSARSFHTPARGSAPYRLSDGQGHELAAVAVDVQPAAHGDRPGAQTVTVHAGAGDEPTIHLADQVQVSLVIPQCHVAGEHFRSRKLTTGQLIVAPQRGDRALVDALHRAVGLTDIDAAEALGHAHRAGGLALPEHAAAVQ